MNHSENVSEQSSDNDDESIDGTDWWREVTMRLKRDNRRPAKPTMQDGGEESRVDDTPGGPFVNNMIAKIYVSGVRE